MHVGVVGSIGDETKEYTTNNSFRLKPNKRLTLHQALGLTRTEQITLLSSTETDMGPQGADPTFGCVNEVG